MTKQKPDAELTHAELVERVRASREHYKKLRDEKNELAARLLKAEAELGSRSEVLALTRAESARLAELLEAAGNDNRLIGMVGRMREQIAALGELADAVGKVLNGDTPLGNMPRHPLIDTAEEVARTAGTNVSWRRVADRRYQLLEELIGMLDAAGGRPPGDAEWVRLLNRGRAELVERVDLP